MDFADGIDKELDTRNLASDHHTSRSDSGNPTTVGNAKFNTYSCDLCNSTATSFEKLREHYEQNHVRGPAQKSITECSKKKHCCPYCDYRSNLLGHVKRHILIHTGETPFECCHCGYKCRDKTVLRRHVERHAKNDVKSTKYNVAENKRFECNTCDFSTRSKGAISRHLLRHEKPQSCQHCGAQFWKKESFKNHVLLHAGIALYPCRSCDYKTNVASNLTSHMKRMHSDKSWVCPECDYATSCPSDLSKHKTIHRSDRPFKCNLCEYSAKRRGHLQSHMGTHNSKVRNYACSFCDYRTTLISTLKVHVRTHTGEKPYTCHICGSGFTSSGGAKLHAYTHIKNWTQTCSLCNFTATKPHLFRQHLKVHTEPPDKFSTKPRDTRSPMPSPKSTRSTAKPTRTRKHTMEVKSALSSKPIKTYENQNPPSNDVPVSINDIKSEPDGTTLKTEPECSIPTLLNLDQPVKTEDLDISHPVKQEF